MSFKNQKQIMRGWLKRIFEILFYDHYNYMIMISAIFIPTKDLHAEKLLFVKYYKLPPVRFVWSVILGLGTSCKVAEEKGMNILGLSWYMFDF